MKKTPNNQKTTYDSTKILNARPDPAEELAGVLGPEYKNYRKLWDKSSQGKFVPDYPVHLDFEITGGCNLRCGVCINNVPEEEKRFVYNPSGIISLSTFKRVISDGIKKGLCSITLNCNNEPFLYKKITDYIGAAKQLGILDIIIHSNANLMTPEISDKLLDSGLTRICFSIDANTRETYSKVRPGGDYNKVISNINYLLEQKRNKNLFLPVTRVSFVVQKSNRHELGAFLEYWKDRVDYVVSQSYISPFVGTSVYQQTEVAYRVNENDTEPFEHCPQPFQRLVIRNNGDVTPCCSWYGYEKIIGNIYNTTIGENWKSGEMQHIRDTVNGSKETWLTICKRCRMAAIKS